MSLFRCPICAQPLEKQPGRYLCPNGHSYDCAAAGYVHLLPVRQKHSKLPGDDKEMVRARKDFLSAGYYRPLCLALEALADQHTGMEPVVVDSGCGEGYYTAGIFNRLTAAGKKPTIAGIDLSKFALRWAAKRQKEIECAVDSADHLPVADRQADLFLNCFSPLALEEFRDCYCVGGIDLSRTTDLTACTAVIEKGGTLYVFARFFLPAERIEEATARDGIPYQAYIQRGFLVPSGDNYVDYRDCFAWFRTLVERYQIFPLKIGYDRYTAQYLVQEMKQYGFHMDDVFQGTNLTPVIRETEGLIKDGVFAIGDNDLLKIHLLDMALKTEAESGRCRPVKINASAHIDGGAALLDAMTVRQKYYAEIGEQLRNEG